MKKSKYVLNFLIIFLLTISVLWFALKDNYREVLEAISQINIFSLAIILCWGVLYTVVWGFVRLLPELPDNYLLRQTIKR